MPAMKKDGPENCEKWVSCCLKAIKYTSAKCHLSLSLSRSRARAINCRTFVGVEEKYIYFPAPPKNSNLLSCSHFPKKKKKIGHHHRFHFWLYNQKTYVIKEERISIIPDIQNYSISVSFKTKILLLKSRNIYTLYLSSWTVYQKQVFSSKFYHRKWLPANGIVIQINKTCVVGIAC